MEAAKAKMYKNYELKQSSDQIFAENNYKK